MLENIRLSLQGILSHKVRSILTMLGIIIGIAAIIAIVSTIKGTNDQPEKCGICFVLPHTFLLQQRILSEHPVQRRHVRHRCQIL